MTIQEASEQYHIPIDLLSIYESWNSGRTEEKTAGDWQCNDSDLEWLSLIMTLHDIGFDVDEIKTYLKLARKGDQGRDERIRMLNQKRRVTLDEIHMREKQLDRLDYLRHEMQKSPLLPKKPVSG